MKIFMTAATFPSNLLPTTITQQVLTTCVIHTTFPPTILKIKLSLRVLPLNSLVTRNHSLTIPANTLSPINFYPFRGEISPQFNSLRRINPSLPMNKKSVANKNKIRKLKQVTWICYSCDTLSINNKTRVEQNKKNFNRINECP